MIFVIEPNDPDQNNYPVEGFLLVYRRIRFSFYINAYCLILSAFAHEVWDEGGLAVPVLLPFETNLLNLAQILFQPIAVPISAC